MTCLTFNISVLSDCVRNFLIGNVDSNLVTTTILTVVSGIIVWFIWWRFGDKIKKLFHLKDKEDANQETLKRLEEKSDRNEEKLDKTTEILTRKIDSLREDISKLSGKPEQKISLSIETEPVQKLSKNESTTKDKKVFIRLNKSGSEYRATSYILRIQKSYPNLEKFLEEDAIKGLRYFHMMKVSEDSQDESFKKFVESEISILNKKIRKVSEWFDIFKKLDSLGYFEGVLIPLSDKMSRDINYPFVRSFTSFCKRISNTDINSQTLKEEFGEYFKSSIGDYKLAFIRVGNPKKVEKLGTNPYVRICANLKQEGYKSLFLFSRMEATNNLSSDIAKILKESYRDITYEPKAFKKNGVTIQIIHVLVEETKPSQQPVLESSQPSPNPRNTP